MRSEDTGRSPEDGTNVHNRQGSTGGGTPPAAHAPHVRPDAEPEPDPILNQELGQGGGLTVAELSALATSMSGQGRLDDAETALRRALDLCPLSTGSGLERAVCVENLATCVSDQGRLVEAEVLYREAFGLHVSFGADTKSRARCRMNLALCLFVQGRTEEAASLGRSAMEQYGVNGRPEVQPVGQRTELQVEHAALDANLPHMLLNLASILHESDPDASQALNTEALEIFRSRPGDERFQARCLANLASCAHRRKELDASETLYREALALLADHETDSRFLADCSVNLAHLLLERNKYGEAMRLATSADTTYHTVGLTTEEMTTGALIGSILLNALESIDDPQQVENLLDTALRTALNAALDADHLRYQFDREDHRLKWLEATAAPMLSLGLLAAAWRGDAALVSGLIATWRMSGSLETLRSEASQPQALAWRGRNAHTLGPPLRAGVSSTRLVQEEAVSPESGRPAPLDGHAGGPNAYDLARAAGGAHTASSRGIRRQVGPTLLMPHQDRPALGRWSGDETGPSARYR